MSFVFLTWGKGKNNTHVKKATEVSDGKIKTEIQKIYAFNESIIYIAQGDLYKEGLLPFERKKAEDKYDKQSDHPKQILFRNISNNMNYQVVDIALGDNHALIQCKNGNLFSWGDNYYGQLGLGSYFVPYIYEPHIVVNISSVDEIMCHKNNSFAIDSARKLWVWGKCELLGLNYKGNLFKPTQILSHQFIEKFKINDGRLIFEVKHYKINKNERKTHVPMKSESTPIGLNERKTVMEGRKSFIIKKEKSLISSSKKEESMYGDDSAKKKLIDDLIKIELSIKSLMDIVHNEVSVIYTCLSSTIRE